MVSRMRQLLSAHKTVVFVVLLTIGGGGLWTYRSSSSATTSPRYVLGTVSSSTIISTISASGQVSADTQLEVKSKVAGDVVYVGVQEGQKIVAGRLLAQLDDSTAQKNIRDASANLASTKINLQKLKQPADRLAMTQAENSVTNAEVALSTAYTDAAGDTSSAFFDLPGIVSGIQDIDIGTATNRSNQWNIDYYLNILNTYTAKAQSYRDDAYASYISAKSAYEKSAALYKSINLATADTASTEKLLTEAYAATKSIFEATKQANALIQLYQDTVRAQYQTPTALSDTQLSNLANYTAQLNTHLSTLLGDINTIATAKQNVLVAQQSLEKLEAGTDPLDIESSQLAVTKAENTLADAQATLTDYYVRAPFAGTVASVALKKYDSVGTGASVATIVTNVQLATLAVNEVDAAKLTVGQKATLTFDAIEGLSIAGTVVGIDTIGAVSQGVVSYNVKINFTTQDLRVKTGMTVNANIIVATALDVLSVPSSAVKTQNGESIVQVFQPELPQTSDSQGVAVTRTPISIPVTIGISDDTNIEIISGLTRGQQIVAKTITGIPSTTSNARPAVTPGGRGGGFRIGG